MITSMKQNLVRPASLALALFALSPGLARAGSASPVTPPASNSVNRVVVWDGESAAQGAGWSNPKGSTIGPQTVVAHSGNTALEFKFKGGGDDWPGAGWNWCAFQ